MQTWKDMNPDWEHKVWTEANMPKLKNQAQFDAMPELNGKADILRYEILEQQGGFNIDADSVCVKPLDEFFVENDSFTCWENEYVRTGLMACGYLGSTKNNRLMSCIIDAISKYDPAFLKNAPNKSAWQTVGPMLLTRVTQEQKYIDLTVYPSWYFIPKHYTGLDQSHKSPIYAEQYYMSTPQSGRSYEEFRS